MNSSFKIMLSSSFFFFFLLLVQLSSAAAGRENPFFELSGREDMVQLAGYGEEKLSSVLVSGTVVCKACLNGETDHELRAWPVADASVTVTCKTGGKRSKYLSKAEGITDEYGDFIIDLPSHLHANPNLDKACTVNVTRLPKNSPCHCNLAGKPKGIRLSSVGNGIRMYTVGTITFKQPSKPWRVCLNKRGHAEEKASM